ncbi:hypothetical protein PM082_004428 [Marasmius tenuissimus]|nr:hypothetical protein PM082_004428 [Marasmius tenuissimus]
MGLEGLRTDRTNRCCHQAVDLTTTVDGLDAHPSGIFSVPPSRTRIILLANNKSTFLRFFPLSPARTTAIGSIARPVSSCASTPLMPSTIVEGISVSSKNYRMPLSYTQLLRMDVSASLRNFSISYRWSSYPLAPGNRQQDLQVEGTRICGENRKAS